MLASCSDQDQAEGRTLMVACHMQGFYAVYAGVFAGVAQTELDAGTGHEDWPEFGKPLHHAVIGICAMHCPKCYYSSHCTEMMWVHSAT